MSEETKENEKILSAKSISKIFKFVASIGVIVCAFLKWAGVLPNASIGEICVAWSVVYGLGAGTIDANLIIDKFQDRINDKSIPNYNRCTACCCSSPVPSLETFKV